MPRGVFILSIWFLLSGSLQASRPIEKLAEAIEKEDLKTVRKMLEEGIDPNIRVPGNSLNYTPLFFAVKSSKPAITEALLKAGADPTLEDDNGDPVMVYASDAETKKHALILIKHGVSIDSKNSMGISPLLRGAPYENGPDVQVKIDLGASVDLTDPRGNTALMRASQAGNLEAMKVLIEAGANLNLVNEAGQSALAFATESDDPFGSEKKKHITAVKLLIEAGIDLNRRDGSGETALLKALSHWGHDEEIIKLLLAAKPDVSVRDEEGRDALFYAVEDRDKNVHLATLLKLGANPKTTDKEGTTLLMLAAANGDLKLVRDLITRGVAPQQQNKNGQTAVHFAAQAKGEEVVSILRVLHENEVSLIAPDREGNTPLHLVARSGREAVFAYLLPKHTKVEITNSQGETPLHLAAICGQGLLIEQLIPLCEHIDRRDLKGRTALMNSMRVDHRWAFHKLVAAGADMDAMDLEGTSSLGAAIRGNELGKVRFLLKHGADPKTVKDPNSELLRVVRLFHDEFTPARDYAAFVDVLAGLVDDIDHSDAEGRTALMWIAASGNKLSLKAILKRKPKLDVRSKDDRTALMWAASAGAAEAMELLIAAGAEESLKDSTGRTALEWLAWSRNEKEKVAHDMSGGSLKARILRSRKLALRNYLKQASWKKEDRVAGASPLILAAGLGDIEAIKRLILLGAPAPLDGPDDEGPTLLMEASGNGQLEMVEFLLGNGADPAGTDGQGRRAVDYAVGHGHGDIARVFLKKKMAFLDDESSLLTTLIHRDDEGLLRDFLKAGAAIASAQSKEDKSDDPFTGRSANRTSVLITAARKPNSKMLRVLMDFPKATGVSDSRMLVLALHHAASQGRLENVKVFIEALKVDAGAPLSSLFEGGTYFDERDPGDREQPRLHDFSPLSRALENGHLNVVRYLVSKGAVITGRTRSGAPPLSYVVDHRGDEMLRFFLKNNAPLELVDFNGETALHRAAVANHKLAVVLLLKQGANPKAKNPDGLTSLALAQKRKAKQVIALLEAASK